MTKAVRISIAMTTYNGARYLAAQLESLAAQRVLPLELVVCDDGSTDDTLSLLEAFAVRSPFPVRLHRNPVNLGFAENFFQAARMCAGDWIAFCDQDDVWLPNRLDDVQRALAEMKDVALVVQSAYLCDAQLAHEGRLFPTTLKPGRHAPGRQFGFWVWLGFLQTFRADLLRELDHGDLPRNYFPGHDRISHDKWTCLIANAIDGVLVLDEPAALYRRHDAALTGSYARQDWKQRIDQALPVGGDHYAFLAEVAEETAQYLRRIAGPARPEFASALLRAAQGFDRMALIQTDRALLYTTRAPLKRLVCLLRIGGRGGYFGVPMTALGWKSGAKDLLRVLGVLSLLHRGARQ
jgi:glycosyltransferase involved in cell wall biosynthesis